jgi:hypothetical protein
MDEERIKKIAELRKRLEDKIKTLETELEESKTFLDLVNEILVEKSFKRAEEIQKPPIIAPAEAKLEPLPSQKKVKAVPLKTKAGEPLADIYIEDGYIRIVPSADKKFNVNMPPFTSFLVDNILEKMKMKDQELVKEGKISENEAFSYEIKADGEIVREITIRNFDIQRERELISATRWTFEKTYQKMQRSL